MQSCDLSVRFYLTFCKDVQQSHKENSETDSEVKNTFKWMDDEAEVLLRVIFD